MHFSDHVKSGFPIVETVSGPEISDFLSLYAALATVFLKTIPSSNDPDSGFTVYTTQRVDVNARCNLDRLSIDKIIDSITFWGPCSTNVRYRNKWRLDGEYHMLQYHACLCS